MGCVESFEINFEVPGKFFSNEHTSMVVNNVTSSSHMQVIRHQLWRSLDEFEQIGED